MKDLKKRLLYIVIMVYAMISFCAINSWLIIEVIGWYNNTFKK
jgi:hypothetical protein